MTRKLIVQYDRWLNEKNALFRVDEHLYGLLAGRVTRFGVAVSSEVRGDHVIVTDETGLKYDLDPSDGRLYPLPVEVPAGA